MKTFIKQRGFTLIEIALVVIITGMIVSGLIIPSSTLLTDDAYSNEDRKMENIKSSIIGYAMSHRTESNIVNVGVRGRITSRTDGDIEVRQFILPAGRPYLPCPDITGDGYEDRVLYDETGMSVPPLTDAIRINRVGNARNIIIERGSCASTRGVLPWRTLGVPPADVWGNLYTYQVDAIFADAMVGFNQNSLIDEFDIRTQIVDTGPLHLYERRAVVTLEITRGGTVIQTVDEQRPPIVCTRGPIGNACSNNLTVGLATITVGLTTTLVAGGLAIRIVDGQQEGLEGGYNFLYRQYRQFDITDGVPFVVVSHGENGNGAVNYSRNFVDKFIANSATPAAAIAPQGLICNWPADSAIITMSVMLDAEAINFPQPHNIPDGGGTTCHPNIYTVANPTERIRKGFMFYQPREHNSGFDDSMMWLGRDELIDIMVHGNALPAPDFPAMRPY